MWVVSVYFLLYHHNPFTFAEAPTTADTVATSIKHKDIDENSGDDGMQTSNNDCPECSIIKRSGKHSCCARGGSWFKKCGDASDPKFNHTWAEGVEACKTFASAGWVADRAEISREEAYDNPPINGATDYHDNVHDRDDLGTVDSTEYSRVSKIFVYTILFIISHW